MEAQERSSDKASQEMIELMAKAGQQNAWDRLEAQSPQCGFGKQGICCRICSMGPCRITKKAPLGICGADADTIAARNLVRMIASGAAAHSDHGRDVAHTFKMAAESDNCDYTIKDELKLREVAARYGIKVEGRETKIRQAIERSQQAYDYILIDCPPSLGLLTFNSLMASTEVFIPIDMGFFSLHGTSRLLAIIDMVRNKTGHVIKAKFIATQYDRRTKISDEILNDIKNNFEGSMFTTVINSNVKLKEAARSRKSIIDYNKRCAGYRDYMSLAEEVIEQEVIPAVRIPAEPISKLFRTTENAPPPFWHRDKQAEEINLEENPEEMDSPITH